MNAETPANIATPANPHAVNPQSMTVAETAKLLSAIGGKRVTSEDVQADVDAGAPMVAGGRINLVHYTAWLAREVQSRGNDER